MIVLDQVSKSLGKHLVLNTLTMAVRPREFVSLTGPSGSGKTTILNLLIGAEKANRGQLVIDGVRLDKVPRNALQLYRRRIGVVFQDHQLFWQRTVRENISFPLEVQGAGRKVITGRVDELLQKLELSDLQTVFCADLSASERARVAIARAIAHKPMIIIADEPTAFLDPNQTASMVQLFRLLHADGATIIFITNNDQLAAALGVRVITMQHGQVISDTNPVDLAAAKAQPETPPKETTPQKVSVSATS